MAELADALDLGSSGRPWGFKSLRAHHKLSENVEISIVFGYFIVLFSFFSYAAQSDMSSLVRKVANYKSSQLSYSIMIKASLAVSFPKNFLTTYIEASMPAEIPAAVNIFP